MTMSTTPAFDHIAFTVPNLDDQIERLTGSFGMVVESRSERFAVVADPATGLKFELGVSEDAGVHFRHLGFRSDDVDGAHETLVDAGMQSNQPPHRRDFARMYTSYLDQPGGLEVQLVRYD
jgi:catechol 2,3-dioxygenase-like lactoylglutathione lyase family enzyme